MNRGGGGGGGGPGRKTVRRNVYRKELFLQANFRFLVADWADLKGSATDPDHVVDWDDVVLVEAGACSSLFAVHCPLSIHRALLPTRLNEVRLTEVHTRA